MYKLSDCCSSLSRDINDMFGVENVRKSERMGDKYPKVSTFYYILCVSGPLSVETV